MYGTMFAIVFPFQRYFPPKSQWVLQETFCPGTPNPVNNPKSRLSQRVDSRYLYCKTGSMIVFESRRLADSKKKGDDSKSRRNREKEQKTYENDDGEESLSLRSDGCTMGGVGTADPSTFPARPQAVCLATRGCQCDFVRAA